VEAPRFDVYVALAFSLDRESAMEALIRRLWDRIEEQQLLLNAAVRELAVMHVSDGQSVDRWTNTWIREHRKGHM
jgi:hypothetical protein